MVNLVLVSHSPEVAEGIKKLVEQMIQNEEITVEAAGGTDTGDIGTSIDKITSAIQKCMSEEGVLVLMDLGSAVMTTEMCLDMLPEDVRGKVKLSNAPLVEGAIAAAGASVQGLSLTEVDRAANETKNTAKVEQPKETFSETDSVEGKDYISTFARITNKTGLHARPASIFVETASRFKSEIRIKNISANKPSVNAKSIMEVATSGTANKGEWVKVMAKGEDAKECLSTLKSLIESGFNEQPEKEDEQDLKEIPSSFSGQAVSEGYAIGEAFIYKEKPPEPYPKHIKNPEEEIKRLRDAVLKTREHLLKAAEQIGGEESGIFQFHEMMLKDEKLISDIEKFIRENSINAEFAVSVAFNKWIRKLSTSSNALMKTRDKDMVDVKERLISTLMGFSSQHNTPPDNSILLTEELLPSDAANIDPRRVKGIAAAFGGTTSHAAIIARTLGIPCVVGLKRGILSIKPGTKVAIDGKEGMLIVDPTEKEKTKLFTREKIFKQTTKSLLKKAKEKAITSDGHRIEVVANIAKPSEAKQLTELGAEGVGLMRSEFLYINRESPPSFEEEYNAYMSVAETMKDKTVVIRTLDAGGDKNIPYLNLEREDNPFLGVRAIRLYKNHIEIFKNQIRAIMKANKYGNVQIMIPMISGVEEILWAKEIIEQEYKNIQTVQEKPKQPSIGIMVEIPSAAILSDKLAKHVDFFSIGSNDLTQYTLACDRGNKNLNYLYDPMHPAVLELIKKTVDSAHSNGIWCGVCGEMAADPISLTVLCGIGVDELSMSPASIPKAKETIRNISFSDVQAIARECLSKTSPKECRKLISDYLLIPRG